MDDTFCGLATQGGFNVNLCIGVYKEGTPYKHTKKLKVAAAFVVAQKPKSGDHPNISAIMQKYKLYAVILLFECRSCRLRCR